MKVNFAERAHNHNWKLDPIVRSLLDTDLPGGFVFPPAGATLLTNDFRGCHPRGEDTLEPLSLVCKLMSADGVPTVKLSDNAQKAVGPPELVARYRRVFGSEPENAEETVV